MNKNFVRQLVTALEISHQVKMCPSPTAFSEPSVIEKDDAPNMQSEPDLTVVEYALRVDIIRRIETCALL